MLRSSKLGDSYAAAWQEWADSVASEPQRRRSARIEVRTTPGDRALIYRAVTESDMDLTQFVVSNLTIAAYYLSTRNPPPLATSMPTSSPKSSPRPQTNCTLCSSRRTFSERSEDDLGGAVCPISREDQGVGLVLLMRRG